MSRIVKIKLKDKSQNYEIKISRNSLEDCGDWAQSVLPENVGKVFIVSNRKVFGLYGSFIETSLKNAGYKVSVWLIGDGEKYKSFSVLENTLKFFSANKLARTDAVVALGGGVIGDLTGFAASVYLRGIPFLQIPTTLLSLIDSSVGGKTAVNSSFGKNLIGTFYQPKGVLIDPKVLQTLPRRELTAGFCEAVKQGAISGEKLFAQTSEFLRNYPVDQLKTILSFDEKKKYRLMPKNGAYFLKGQTELENLIAAQISFKAEIVAGDEHEDLTRVDSRSRKILNFGHTVAHALEKITNYTYFKHGEAVGYGILAAAEISKRVANFAQNELNLLNDVVNLTGQLPKVDHIEIEQVIQAFAFDKKQIGKSLQWVLLESIGSPKIIQSQNIPNQVIKKSLKQIFKS